ncbi:MAG: hypothetical protein KJP21_06190 [Bacteroidia bacterium]|nr:hypothetical protein [Bacteroidia bacterium]NNJ55200.1 hypothetical protein [Bacteroidia bacterium]
MFKEYLLSLEITQDYKPYEIGSSLEKFVSKLPSLEGKKAAIIGIPEGRYNPNNEPTANAPEKIRNELYRLSSNSFIENRIVDLGNIKLGKTKEDTFSALKHVCKYLHDQDIVTILIGGNVALSEAVYQSFSSDEQNMDLTFISSKLPILEGELLDRIIKNEENHLINLNAIAFQSHCIPPKALDVIQNLSFGHVRLGALKKNIDEAELLIRNSNMIVFDVNAVKYSEAPGNQTSNPIGIDGDMACQLAWYSGVSDASKNFGLFDTNPSLDLRNVTSKLMSLILWYFIDGLANRKHDHPKLHEEFTNYRCHFDNNHSDIIFHKSKRTSRWWMEIPHPRSLNNSDMNVIIPCSYEDYQEATSGNIPDRFLNALQQLH